MDPDGAPPGPLSLRQRGLLGPSGTHSHARPHGNASPTPPVPMATPALRHRSRGNAALSPTLPSDHHGNSRRWSGCRRYGNAAWPGTAA